ncbi:glycosyltransferase family 4 protein [Hutsoniella sourekii]|uniref:glycosyltransferase family 4 protein n=1 Tax=Hutsoniella sourekii TaxID=87650 RepID=UPI0004808EB6|nr:glycosyltransferase family 4 protein [Hutsoniella sourekii]
MKIGMFTDTYFPQISGVSSSIQTLKEQLEARGHQVIIFTTTDPEADVQNGLVRLPSVPFASFEERRIAYSGLDRSLKIARQHHLDLIHTHTEFSLGLAGKYIASRLGIPLVHTYHTMYENYTHYIMDGTLISGQHVRVLTKMFCNHVDAVIAPSQMTQDKLLEYGLTSPIHIIPTGVEVPDWDEASYQANRRQMRAQYGLEEVDQVLLSVSRLSKEKQIDQIIQMFSHLQDQSNCHLVIAGDGPAKEELVDQVSSLGLERVLFIGAVDHDQIDRLYQMADLYVNASESESQGLTYLEALVNRLPVIAKRNEFLDGLITDPAMGHLYEDFSDFPQAVKNALARLTSQEGATIDQDRLYQLSSDRFGDQVESLYLDLIQHPDKRQPSPADRVQAHLVALIRNTLIGKKDE